MTKHYLTLILFFNILVTLNAQEFSINVNGDERTYIVHLPSEYSEDDAFPVVLNFHGLGGSSTQQQLYTNMDQVADNEGFIVVYPQGMPDEEGQNTWNVYQDAEGPDDLAFINELLDQLISEYTVNEQRIYSTGFSMGGFMSYFLACNLSDRIAAIAPVAGVVMTQNCSPSERIPVFHIHGTEDEVVEYESSFLGAPQSVDHFTNHNQCTGTRDSTRLPGDGDASMDLFQHTSCDENTEVWLLRINGGGHAWPGTGSTVDYDTDQEIWDFFSRFTLDPVPVANMKSEKTETNVYPNPAKSIIHIETAENKGEVLILDASGRVIYRQDHFRNIDTDRFSDGLYYMKIVNGKKSSIKKIMIE